MLTDRIRNLALKTARILAWSLSLVIVILSIVPPTLRPETDMPHRLEHFAIFFPAGIAFGYGYGRRPLLLAIALIVFAGLIEASQLLVHGRHARLSDFIVDAASVCIGVAVASLGGARALQGISGAHFPS